MHDPMSEVRQDLVLWSAMRTTLDGVQAIGFPKQDSNLPGSIRIPKFMLSQSGSAFPVDYGNRNQKPLLPGLEGAVRMEVTGLSPSGTRTKNEFAIDDQGRLQPNSNARPLGHVPYEVAIVMEDGTRYSGVVDISRSKTGVSHQGYDTIEGLELTRVPPPPPAQVELGSFYLSQSGQALPIQGEGPIVPNNDGFFQKMVVTGLSPSGTRLENSFDLSPDGRLQSKVASKPLGHVPYEIALIGRDGSRYTAVKDISPSKTGVSHQGYDTISGLVLKRQGPTPDLRSEAPMNSSDAQFMQTGGPTNQRPTLGGSPMFLGVTKRQG